MGDGAGKIVFVVGGTRSGKSSFALKRAEAVSGKKAYIATAEPLDDEMRERIERHKAQRGKDWVTYEETSAIADVVKEIAGKHNAIIIDCLTLWLSNLMYADLDVEAEVKHFITSLKDMTSPIVVYIVSNEVGMGIVPENDLARRFRDMAGTMNQKVAEAADEVYLVTAGIPLKIK